LLAHFHEFFLAQLSVLVGIEFQSPVGKIFRIGGTEAASAAAGTATFSIGGRSRLCRPPALSSGGAAFGVGPAAFSRGVSPLCIRAGFAARPAEVAEVGSQFFGADFAIFVLVERLQRDGRIFDFFVGQFAIAIGVERLHDRELKAAAARTAKAPSFTRASFTRPALGLGGAAVAFGTLGLESGTGDSRQGGHGEGDDGSTHERDPPEVKKRAMIRDGGAELPRWTKTLLPPKVGAGGGKLHPRWGELRRASGRCFAIKSGMEAISALLARL